MTGNELSGDAVDIGLSIDSDGAARLAVTIHDDRLHERLYLLRNRGASRHGDTWILEADNIESISEFQAHLVGMVADVVAPKPLTQADKEAVYERAENHCRVCSKDFERPHIAENQAREHVRIVDHIYPAADAKDIHTPNEPINLAAVCGGCDDAVLQGDSLRFVADRISKALDREDRQILAWLQKRPLFRSDWLLTMMNEVRDSDRQVSKSLIDDRLVSFSRLGLLRHEADIAPDEAFEVYRVNLHSDAVVFLDTDAVGRHRSYLPLIEFAKNCDENLIEMAERESPELPELTGVV